MKCSVTVVAVRVLYHSARSIQNIYIPRWVVFAVDFGWPHGLVNSCRGTIVLASGLQGRETAREMDILEQCSTHPNVVDCYGCIRTSTR